MLHKICFAIIMLLTMSANAQLKYQVSFENRNAHYVRVQIEIPTTNLDSLTLSMPVWTPGSYKVREFSQNVDFCKAYGDDNHPLSINKTNKNTWVINSKGEKSVRFVYEVYAFEISVRQSYADQYYAFLHGVSVFMRVEEMDAQPISLTLLLPDDWKQSEVALEGSKHIYQCANYDELADSPIACGNFETASFISMGVPQKIVMIGKGNYDLEKFKKDVKGICDEAGKIIGSHPCKQYIHFIQNVNAGGGGLEHANCQTSQMTRFGYNNPSQYNSLLALIAHEYFHLWNVKRLRPAGLGPFEYNKEVYTDMLWFSEGFTSYYDDLIAYKYGLYTRNEYLRIISQNISNTENTHGTKVSSLSDASFNAWIKTYLSNENTNNTVTSYYGKGMLVALLTDLELRSGSEGKISLNDVMRTMYNTYYIAQNKGFTYQQLLDAIQTVSGRDFSAFYYSWIYTTETPDYARTLAKMGLTATISDSKNIPSLHMNTQSIGKLSKITFVELGGAASLAGLSVNDLIVKVDGKKYRLGFEKRLSRTKPGETIRLEVWRQGLPLQIDVKIGSSNKKVWQIHEASDITPDQRLLLNGWLEK